MLTARHDCGFTLVETLIALGLMLAGLAGSALLLVRTTQFERASAEQRTALRFAASLAEELRARRQPDAGPVDPADAFVQDWAAAVIAALPVGASAGVDAAGPGAADVRIVIAWPTAGGGSRRLELAVRS